MGLPYHPPHKFRNGNAVYSIKKAKDVKDLKAISQNLMHSNLSSTDGVYGILSSQDVGDAIKNLGEKASDGEFSKIDLINQLEKIISDYKK